LGARASNLPNFMKMKKGGVKRKVEKSETNLGGGDLIKKLFFLSFVTDAAAKISKSVSTWLFSSGQFSMGRKARTLNTWWRKFKEFLTGRFRFWPHQQILDLTEKGFQGQTRLIFWCKASDKEKVL
jgi:hypothetical protein